MKVSDLIQELESGDRTMEQLRPKEMRSPDEGSLVNTIPGQLQNMMSSGLGDFYNRSLVNRLTFGTQQFGMSTGR